MDIQEAKLVLLAADLAGYARACAHQGALDIARFLDAWYHRFATAISARGGRVVKFIGDGCLAVFPEDRVLDAVDVASELAEAVRASRGPWRIELGANVHLAVVAEGDFGPEPVRRYDVLGSGVNHLFLMGGGAGIRISEPVFRQLPAERRTVWAKRRPPATYTLE